MLNYDVSGSKFLQVFSAEGKAMAGCPSPYKYTEYTWSCYHF